MKVWLRFIMLVLLVVAVLGPASVIVESIFRPPDASISWWWATAPVSMVVNGALVSIVGLLMFGLTARPLTSILLTLALLLVMTLAHASTIATLGRPLFPWDVLLFREAMNLQPYLSSMAYAWLWAAGAGALLVMTVASFRVGPRVGWSARVVLTLPFAVAALWLFPDPAGRLNAIGVNHTSWVQVWSYRTNGLPLTFLMNLPAANVGRPSNYSRASVQEALSRGETHEATPSKPDVIIVMSEAFFDVTRIPNIRFENDPLPTLHRLQREAASGTMYAPTFGGGTANTEFELLTGHSMRFLPYGSIPYQQYLNRDSNSLPRIFAAQGYRTSAVHIFHRWFWEREQVYQRLGIQQFVSMEGLSLTGESYFPQEENLTREMIKVVEESTDPLFLFAIGVEAHGPYEPNRYPNTSVRIEGPLDDAARAELVTYSEAISHADRELGRLIDYLEKRDRPAIVVFFGDHLPSLPLTLKQTGVAPNIDGFGELTLQQRAFLYEVPLVLWSNVNPGQRELGNWSSAFLGPLILNETGTPGTPYTDFLDGVRKEFPIVTQSLLADSRGQLHEEAPSNWSAIARDWWILEYDALFGNNYAVPIPDKG